MTSEPTFEPYADRGDKIDLVIRKGKRNVYVFENKRWWPDDSDSCFIVWAPAVNQMSSFYTLIAAQIEATRWLDDECWSAGLEWVNYSSKPGGW